MKVLLSFIVSLSALFLLNSCQTTGSMSKSKSADAPAMDPLASVVKVNVTSQSYSFIYPWNKKQPYNKSGYATYIDGDRYLITASMVQDANFIELEKIKTGEKTPAKVEIVDYMANLAIIKTTNKAFQAGMKPLQLANKLTIGSDVEALQFEANGLPLQTKGELRKAALGLYTHNRLLVYHIRITLPQNSNKQIPMIHNGKLAGIMLSYSSTTNSLTMIPGPVIEHFLKDYADGSYGGFPSGGFTSTRLDDPELRQFVKLPDNESGIYISYVRPGSPADKSGLKENDVLISIDDYKLDRNGEYEDKEYGKMSISHLLSTHSQSGDIRKFKIWRDGALKILPVKMFSLDLENFPSKPFVYDRGPDFIIVGGIIFTELSRQFLKEWRSWQTNSPARLRYYDRKQWELFQPGQKLIISSMTIPTQSNNGYNRFAFKVLNKVNGIEIKTLADIESALAKPIVKSNGSFQVFEFDKSPKTMVFTASDLKSSEQFLRLRYNIQTQKRITRQTNKQTKK